MEGVKRRTYLTHLVTPLDMKNRPQNVAHRFHNGRRVGVIARMDRNNQIFSTPKILNFNGVRSGGVFEPKWLNENYTAEEIQGIIWDLFAKKTSIDFGKTKDIPGVDFWDYEAWEGDNKVVGLHLRKERDRELVKQAKAKALADGNGRITCECCGFDFSAFYGGHGRNFIECHHRDPIGLGGVRKSKIDDLAMVCSNCHRMLHRRIRGKIDYYTVESLSELIKK